MNSMSKLFRFIESIGFTSSAYAANTLASFTVYTESSIEYKQAFDNLKQNASESARLLADRVDALMAAHNDEQYMHPYDASLAVYFYLIYQLSPEIFRKRISPLVFPGNMWWAKQMISVLRESLNTTHTAVYRQDSANVAINYNEQNNAIQFTSGASNELRVMRL